MTIAVVDGDIVCYRSAASAEKDPEEIALIRASKLLQDIISTTDADEIKLFLSGSANFRKDIYPEYKANRANLPRPKWLQQCREYLVLRWGADVTDGIEADDAIGIEASRGNPCIIASIDKDLRQIPGIHYNFVTGEFSEIDEIEGWRNFYKQCVLGDRGDNVPGYDGKMRLKFPKFLTEIREKLDRAETPYQMYQSVKEIYKSEETLIRNARLLYLWRKENDEWQPPTSQAIMSEEKPAEGEKSESTATTLEGNTRSTERGGTKPRKSGSRRRGRSTATASRKKPQGL